jgi:hypothetical protein
LNPCGSFFDLDSNTSYVV